MRRRIATLLLGAMSLILGAGVLHILHHDLVQPIEHYCSTEAGKPCHTSEDEGCIYLDLIPPPVILGASMVALVCLVALLGVLETSGAYRRLLHRAVDRYSLSDPPRSSYDTMGLSPEWVWRVRQQGI